MEDKLRYDSPVLMELVIAPTIVRGGGSEEMTGDEEEGGNPDIFE